jgi:hypothetical protein
MADQIKITGTERRRKPIATPRLVLSRTTADTNSPLEKHLGSSPYVDVMGFNPGGAVRFGSDFLQASGGALAAPFAVQDTSAGGSPVKDFVDDAVNGEYKILQAATDEAENLTLYFGDQLVIPANKGWVFQCRVKIDMDTAPWSADQRIVWGVGSARNATLDSMTLNAWFKLDGASLAIVVESDDGTTDTNDQATGVSLVDNTYISLRIDGTNLSAVQFLIDQEAGDGFVLVGTTSMPLATANLQIFMEMQKDAGTETEDWRTDYAFVVCRRY